MSLRTARTALLGLLTLLAVVGPVFYHWQNAEGRLGGGISLPTVLWLAWVIAAWFLVPPILMSDARLDARLRRLFRLFWIAMLFRGVVQLALLYLVVHWHPLYGILHDAFCLVLLLLLRRGVAPTDTVNRRGLQFSGTLVVSLIVEIAFAAMFMQTGAHEWGSYFVSNDASLTYINLVTWVAIVFAYPDIVAMLGGLYFPGRAVDMLPVIRWSRILGAAMTVLIVSAALALWTWMMGLERSAERFKQIGFQIMDSCAGFESAFLAADTEAMADFATSCRIAWRTQPVDHTHDFELARWVAEGAAEEFSQAMIRWRERRTDVLQATFKMHLLDDVLSDREAIAQIRFEVTGPSAADAGMLRCRFRRSEDERWRVVEASVIEGATTRAGGDLFVDRAAASGIDFVVQPDRRFAPGDACREHECHHPGQLRFQMMRFAYAGCATGDYDGDGYDDLFFCSGGKAALYHNRGDGTFEPATERAGLGELWHISCASFADLDNDGDQDLYLAAFYGPNYLFENNGDGTFTDITQRTGLGDDEIIACLALLDYDNDGDLDLYLGRPLDARYHIPDSFLYTRNGQPNILYRNDGDLRFTDVTKEAGVGDTGLTLSIAAADYDGDGDQDLYVANDFGRNVFYQNQGDGTFKDVALETGSSAIGGSMSASWGDYNNDGRLDLYVAAIRSNERWFVQPLTVRRVMLKYIREGRLLTTNPLFQDLYEQLGDDWVNIGNHALAGNSLLEQLADGTFIDRAEVSGTRPAGWYWSSGFFDIENDGDLDIYATDGWITGDDPHDL